MKMIVLHFNFKIIVLHQENFNNFTERYGACLHTLPWVSPNDFPEIVQFSKEKTFKKAQFNEKLDLDELQYKPQYKPTRKYLFTYRIEEFRIQNKLGQRLVIMTKNDVLKQTFESKRTTEK